MIIQENLLQLQYDRYFLVFTQYKFLIIYFISPFDFILYFCISIESKKVEKIPPTGIEPATSGLKVRCSNLLNYRGFLIYIGFIIFSKFHFNTFFFGSEKKI